MREEMSRLPGCEQADRNEDEGSRRSRWSAKELLSEAVKVLSEVGIEDAAPEGRIMLEWICGIDMGTYYADPDAVIPQEMARRFLSVLKKRTERIPLQYLMKECEFMGYSFYVDERVLIPRQDTECLVEEAVRMIKLHTGQLSASQSGAGQSDTGQIDVGQQSVYQLAASQNCPGHPLRVLDLCTGSGCIGISVKLLCPHVEVTLADVSEEALSVARHNAKRLKAEVDFVQGDLFSPVSGRFDFILSNPPYIPTNVIGSLMPEVRDHEPMLALDGEEDGLAFYRRILHEAGEYLYPGGALLLEIGMEQGRDVAGMLRMEGYQDVRIIRDLAGRDRVAAGNKSMPL